MRFAEGAVAPAGTCCGRELLLSFMRRVYQGNARVSVLCLVLSAMYGVGVYRCWLDASEPEGVHHHLWSYALLMGAVRALFVFVAALAVAICVCDPQAYDQNKAQVACVSGVCFPCVYGGTPDFPRATEMSNLIRTSTSGACNALTLCGGWMWLLLAAASSASAVLYGLAARSAPRVRVVVPDYSELEGVFTAEDVGKVVSVEAGGDVVADESAWDVNWIGDPSPPTPEVRVTAVPDGRAFSPVTLSNGGQFENPLRSDPAAPNPPPQS